MAVRSSGSLTQASAASSFWVRYAARYLLNASCPALLGPRDRLCHFDTQPPWMPDLPLGRFVGSALTVFDLPDQADAVRAFLEFWLPVQALRVLQRVLIEFSVTAGESGLGLMLYGNNLTMTQAFVKYCRQHGLGGETSELCRAICATFRPSDLGMVRAEFRRGGPTRQSIAASWLFDTLREHDALAEQLRRLPAEARLQALAWPTRRFAAALAPDFYPLFLGLSFDDTGLESKLYLVRFDDDRSPLQPASTLWNFIAAMGVPKEEMQRLRRCCDFIWRHSVDKMTQLAIEVSPGEAVPRRVNLIYCGTALAAMRRAVTRFGLDAPQGRLVVDRFQGLMQTDRAKYVALRVSPAD